MDNPSSSQSNRRTERWFRRALWLISLVFASFLIGLGSKVVDDLPKVETDYPISHYVSDLQQYQKLTEQKNQLEKQLDIQNQKLAQAELDWEKQQNHTQAARAQFQAALATRKTTEIQQENQKVFEKTQQYEQLIQKQGEAENTLAQIKQAKFNTEQQISQISDSLNEMEAAAEPKKRAADKIIELKIFLYRLALTLPLLLLAVYLFKNKRQSRWFPFVWGFIFFALFVFFVELLPYLPSYGGYVRYVVGIALTVLLGKYAIGAMYLYLERKQAEEAQPENQRAALNYDLAQNRLAKKICPACERPLDFHNENMDFCPHCRTRLFRYCGHCQTRSTAFNRYCLHCGEKNELFD